MLDKLEINFGENGCGIINLNGKPLQGVKSLVIIAAVDSPTTITLTNAGNGQRPALQDTLHIL